MVYLFCSAALFTFGGSAWAGYIANGGFESGLTGWTGAQNSGTATFTPTTQDAKFDKQCLQVVVNSAGSSSSYPRLTYTTRFTASSTNTYTLSFFARCTNASLNNRPSKLRIHLDGTFANFSYDYTPSNMWAEYHYSFAKTTSPITFSITFESAGTFELDRIILVDQNEPTVNNQAVLETPTSYLWQWGQQDFNKTSRYPVSGTDNDIAQQLPDGRVAWLFNDSDLAPLDYTTNYRGYDTGAPRNAVVIQNGNTLTPLKVNAYAFNSPNGGKVLWPLDGTIESNKLRVTLNEVDGGSLEASGNYYLASYSLPGLTEDSPFLVSIPWGGPVLNGNDGYFYIYDDKKDDASRSQRRLARAPAGSLGDGSKWTFWNGSTWIANKSAATVLPGLSTAWVSGSSFERLGANNFVAISYGIVGSGVGVHFAPTPAGPWTDYLNIYSMPFESGPKDSDGGEIYYDFRIYKHTGQNGAYTIGFSDYQFGGDNKVDDKCYYWPQYIKTPNLLGMSPYTSNTFRDDFPSQDFSNWQTYGGNWAEGFGLFVVDATATANNGARAIAKGVVLSDFVFDANVRSNTANGAMGLVFRTNTQAVGVNAYQGYYASIQPGGGVTLSRVNGTSATVLASASMNLATNTSYHMKVVGSGSTIKVYVTDMVTPVIAVNDDTYPSGGFGLRSSNATGFFDDVVITDQRYEAESLSMAASSGAAATNFYDPGLASAGAGVNYTSKAVGDYVTYKLPQVSPGKYTLSVRVKRTNTGGIYSVGWGDSATATSVVGSPVDTYSNLNFYSELNLGTVQVSSQVDKFVKFTLTGKAANSQAYVLALDSIKLTPLVTPYNTWQAANFTPAEQFNEAVGGDQADPDGDGIPNLLEYALNLNPRVAGTQGLPTAGSMVINGDQYMTLTYQQVIGATDLVYTPQLSVDLVNWSSGTGYLTPVSTTNNPDGLTRTVVVRDVYPLGSANKRFLRLLVTKP